MILVDTSVLINHLRRGDDGLATLLEANEVLMHSWVAGESAMGTMHRREATLELLHSLPPAPVVDHESLMRFVDAEHLYGQGIGLVDAHLLASVRAVAGILLWTRDRRLAAIADRLGVCSPGVDEEVGEQQPD